METVANLKNVNAMIRVRPALLQDRFSVPARTDVNSLTVSKASRGHECPARHTLRAVVSRCKVARAQGKFDREFLTIPGFFKL